MEDRANILVVQGEKDISDCLMAILTSSGYEAALATCGKRAIYMTADTQFDLILLDLGLPDIDGLRVLKSIREWSEVPIIAVSDRCEEFEKVEALDAGADDHIAKPFGNDELLARIRAVLRIYRKAAVTKTQRESSFTLGSVFIDYDKRAVMKNGQLIHFTPIEYKILVLLSQRAGAVLTREEILRRIWGENYVSDGQILRVNMANIRRKLEDNPAEPKYILTEPGIGYRLGMPE